jgi:hypothetical protein
MAMPRRVRDVSRFLSLQIAPDEDGLEVGPAPDPFEVDVGSLPAVVRLVPEPFDGPFVAGEPELTSVPLPLSGDAKFDTGGPGKT